MMHVVLEGGKAVAPPGSPRRCPLRTRLGTVSASGGWCRVSRRWILPGSCLVRVTADPKPMRLSSCISIVELKAMMMMKALYRGGIWSVNRVV